MLFRDLLVALPGLVTPMNTAARAEDAPLTTITPPATTSAQASGQISNPFKLAQQGSSSGSTLRDFYQSNGISEDLPTLVKAEPGEDVPVTSPPDPVTPTPPGGGEALPSQVMDLSATAGRVQVIDPVGTSVDTLSKGAEISGIRILEQAAHGHASVNPDNTIALVLSEDPQDAGANAFRYEITYADGNTREVEARISVEAGPQKEGWAQGNVYMLEEDAKGNLVVEHGENHRKVHVTDGAHGLTAAEIARAEGLNAGAITAKWLAEHPEYGATPDKALSSELGIKLWYHITSQQAGPNSNWLLFERGYQYDDTDRLIGRGSMGESALNPMFIGAYGEGRDPILTDPVQIYGLDSNHVVLQGLDIGRFMALQGSNLLLDHISINGVSDQTGLNVQGITGFTLRHSNITDVARLTPIDGGDIWQAHVNRASGAYISNTTGMLLEGNLFDHNGWGDGYDPNLSTKSPQPPSMFSHNLYIQADNLDVTLRDNILMRGGSFGAQVRSGGLIENNSFIDNNAAVNFRGGDDNGAGREGNYTLMLDNLVTSAGHKRVAQLEGALSMGIEGGGSVLTSYIGNIVAHLADPNNPAEQAQKQVVNGAFAAGENPYFNDTIIYNWSVAGKSSATNPDTNIAGLDTAVLDRTTIQNFTAQLLGKQTATIADLADYLRAQAAGRLDHVVDADLINDFFRAGFGLETDLRAAGATLRFAPDDRGEGMRWDNRLNWSTGDLPGTRDGDSVDLGGNRVLFGAKTVTVDDFIFGDFGQLKASSGRLNIGGEMSVAGKANLLETANAGQIWVDGYHDSDLLRIDAQGGRFANSGAFAGGVKMSVGGDAQAILATGGASFDLAKGSSLTVTGTKAKTGFDGDAGETAVLRLHDGAKLGFVAGADGFGQIREFHSGAFETGDVTSGVRLNGDLSIDLGGWTAGPKAASWTLIDADQLIGSFDELSVKGLDNDRDLLVRIDYVKDQVTLLIGADGAGSGQTRISANGEADFIDYTRDAALKQLWEDLNADLPQVSDSPL